MILFRDITELRRTETMRRDFVANVSHELRTPLSILRGYLETLLENPKQPPAELLRIFEIMERHSNRLNLLVDDVLSLARLEGPGLELDLTTVRPAIFLRGIMRDWEKKFAAKKLQVELDAADDLPPLQADEARLQEVIYNLLDNAVKYSPAGGKITVRASRDDGRLSFSVSDNGGEFPPAICHESLSVFIGPTKRVIANWAGPVSGFRSLNTSLSCTADRSRRKAKSAEAPPFAFPCRSQPHKRNIKNFARLAAGEA